MRFHPILDKKCNLWKLRKRFFAHKESDKGQVKGGIQMAKRGENIHKRKDGRWEGRCIKRRTTDEKPIWGYLYGYAYGIVKDILMKRKVLSGALHNYWDGLFCPGLGRTDNSSLQPEWPPAPDFQPPPPHFWLPLTSTKQKASISYANRTIHWPFLLFPYPAFCVSHFSTVSMLKPIALALCSIVRPCS